MKTNIGTRLPKEPTLSSTRIISPKTSTAPRATRQTRINRLTMTGTAIISITATQVIMNTRVRPTSPQHEAGASATL